MISQPEPNNSREQQQQVDIFFRFVEQWKINSHSGPCLVIGDLNIMNNMLKLDRPDQQGCIIFFWLATLVKSGCRNA